MWNIDENSGRGLKGGYAGYIRFSIDWSLTRFMENNKPPGTLFWNTGTCINVKLIHIFVLTDLKPVYTWFDV